MSYTLERRHGPIWYTDCFLRGPRRSAGGPAGLIRMGEAMNRTRTIAALGIVLALMIAPALTAPNVGGAGPKKPNVGGAGPRVPVDP